MTLPEDILNGIYLDSLVLEEESVLLSWGKLSAAMSGWESSCSNAHAFIHKLMKSSGRCF